MLLNWTKTLVGLFYRSTLPTVGRVSDVEWVVVSDSSCHSLCVSKINCHLPSVIVLLFIYKVNFLRKGVNHPRKTSQLMQQAKVNWFRMEMELLILKVKIESTFFRKRHTINRTMMTDGRWQFVLSQVKILKLPFNYIYIINSYYSGIFLSFY